MGSLLLAILLLALAAVVVIGVSTWASTKSLAIRNILGFCLCVATAYCVGFVINIWVLTAAGTIPAGNLIAPTFTWLAIALICLFAAFHVGSSRLALGSPFFLNAVLAFIFSSSVSAALLAAGSLVVVGIAILLYRRQPFTASKAPTCPSFPIGEYRLDAAISQLTDLVEFSPAEYTAMGRQFAGEIDYNARPASFLDQSWNVNL